VIQPSDAMSQQQFWRDTVPAAELVDLLWVTGLAEAVRGLLPWLSEDAGGVRRSALTGNGGIAMRYLIGQLRAATTFLAAALKG